MAKNLMNYTITVPASICIIIEARNENDANNKAFDLIDENFRHLDFTVLLPDQLNPETDLYL